MLDPKIFKHRSAHLFQIDVSSSHSVMMVLGSREEAGGSIRLFAHGYPSLLSVKAEYSQTSKSILPIVIIEVTFSFVAPCRQTKRKY